MYKKLSINASISYHDKTSFSDSFPITIFSLLFQDQGRFGWTWSNPGNLKNKLACLKRSKNCTEMLLTCPDILTSWSGKSLPWTWILSTKAVTIDTGEIVTSLGKFGKRQCLNTKCTANTSEKYWKWEYLFSWSGF